MRRSLKVYPRACGGTRARIVKAFDGWGLSPRMRGNRSGDERGGCVNGSIPAHAGEPTAYVK